MNERIKEFMDQAGIDVEAVENLGEMPTALKFAELIVRECVQVINADCELQYSKGVITNLGGLNQARELIKQHFGVEE